MIMDELDDLFTDDLNLEENLNDDLNSDAAVITEDDDIFESSASTSNSSIINDLLLKKGINDGKIKVVNEDESEEEIDFYSLSKEEQLEILNSSDSDHDYGLEEEEIELLNELRSKGLTWKQYLDQYKESLVSESSSDPIYEIDAYDDQELFLLDLKEKYDLTDEELEKELEKELKDEELFKKKIDKIRSEYKTLEDQRKQDQQVEFERKQQERYDEFVDTMVNVAVKTPDLHGIELEDSEKNEVLSFLLDLDESGVSNFYKTLNDPSRLYEAAWFLKYGKDAFQEIVNAYEFEISKLKKDTKKSNIVVKKPKSGNTTTINNIHDLF